MNRTRGPDQKPIRLIRADYTVSDTGYTAAQRARCCVFVDAETVLLYLVLCLVWGGVLAAVILAWQQVQ